MMLPPHQHRVLRARAQGLTWAQIAHQLGLSQQTCKRYMTTAYRSLDARCLVDALRAVGWLVVPGDQKESRHGR